MKDQLTDVRSITAAYSAFAALKGDGSVVTWGDAECGGDSTSVQAQLTYIRSIVASGGAFAASRADGRVVTWGEAAGGGDSSSVQAQLG